MGTETGVHWVYDRAWCAQWWSGEASYAKGTLSLLQVETSLVQSESVLERENESVWGEHSFECHVAKWLLDSVEAARTSVGILVPTSLEPDGGFQARPQRRLRNFSGRSFTVRDTNWPEFSLSAQLICTFVRNTVSRGILPVLKATVLCIRCWCAGIWLGGVRNNAYGARRSLVELTRRGSTRGAGNHVWSGRTGVRG